MGDSFIFQFIKKWRQVGAIMPSSIFLVEDMLEEVDWNSTRLVVELGAGSGSFTKEILKKMHPDSKLFVFEIDKVFIKKLSKIEDKRMILVPDSATNISKYLNGEKAGAIISGIPLSNLDKKIKSEIIKDSIKNLSKDGVFLQFQYFPESYNFLKDYFNDIKVRFTLLNTPPAFFYICKL
jgi:phospholipid N-methyltransferase